jgi:hypothetical protein
MTDDDILVFAYENGFITSNASNHQQIVRLCRSGLLQRKTGSPAVRNDFSITPRGLERVQQILANPGPKGNQANV